jgi:hypothetical protein
LNPEPCGADHAATLVVDDVEARSTTTRTCSPADSRAYGRGIFLEVLSGRVAQPELGRALLGPFRAAWHRPQLEEARATRDAEVRALLEAVLRKLE